MISFASIFESFPDHAGLYIVAGLSIYVGSLGAVALYRLFLDPLAKFPGPRLAAVSRWYEGYYDVVKGGQYTFKIGKLHKQYGPIIRISPYEIHLSDPAFYETLYRHEGRWNKYDWSQDAFDVPNSTICAVDHDLHRHRRAPLNSFLSKARVTSRQDLIHRLCGKLCNRIAQGAGSGAPFPLGDAVSAFTRDVAGAFLLDCNFGHLEKNDFSAGVTQTFQGGGRVWQITKHVPWFTKLMKIIPPSMMQKGSDPNTRSFFTFLRDMQAITRETLDAEAAGEPLKGERTLIHQILDSKLPDSDKTFSRIHDEVSTIAGAAFETTAQSLRVICFHIYDNPVILARLREELDAAQFEGDTMTVSALEQLPYLTGVLMEGLRICPGIATRSARVTPDRELVYDKWMIPAGTPVGMTTVLMHHDETLYPEPKKFEPERWTDLEVRRKAEKTFAPFSRGTRNCMGMQLAWAEMYVVVANIVRRFDMDFQRLTAKDFECCSDRFIVASVEPSRVKALVTEHHG